MTRGIERVGRIMGQVWRIAERKFKDDWMRMRLFDMLVWLVMSYGVKVWGSEKIGHIWESKNEVK